jgi:hypothetical protein
MSGWFEYYLWGAVVSYIAFVLIMFDDVKMSDTLIRIPIFSLGWPIIWIAILVSILRPTKI